MLQTTDGQHLTTLAELCNGVATFSYPINVLLKFSETVMTLSLRTARKKQYKTNSQLM